MSQFFIGLRRLVAAVWDLFLEVLDDRFWEGCGPDLR